MEEVSKYKNNSVASKKKHIYTRLLDYFSVFVLSYLVFTIVYAIGARLPGYTRDSETYSNQGLKVLQYIGETHLRTYDEEEQNLKDSSIEAVNYLTTLTKTSAYIYDKTYPVKQDDGTYIEQAVKKEDTFINNLEAYEKDNISYYFKKFKKADASLNNYVIDGVDYKDDIDTYLYIKIMKYDPNNFISGEDTRYITKSEGISKFLILNEDNTNKMINRLAKGETIDESAVKLYNSLTGTYGNTVQYGIDEVENKSSTYKSLIDDFNATYQKLALHIALMYLIAYLLAYVGLTVAMRFIAKEWVTIGQKVLNIAMCRNNDMEIGVGRLISYHLINFLLFSSSSLLGFYIIGMFGVFSLQIFPYVNLLSIMLALLTLSVISLFMPFFKGNYDLATFITRISLRDKNEYDASVNFDDISDAEYEELTKIEDDNGKD